MRKFLCKALVLALTLAIACAPAALAETLDEFCGGYNECLPVYFATFDVDEETVNILVDALSFSYSEEHSQNVGFPTYASDIGNVTISFLSGDDPYAGFALGIIGDEDSDIKVPAYAFLTYFAYRLDLEGADVVSSLVAWLLSSNEGSGWDFGDYEVTYTRTENYIFMTFFK